MSTQHTPGPWLVADLYRDSARIVSEEWGAVASVHNPYHGGRIEADAKLLAAAPELLAALQMVCDSGVNLAEPIERAMLDAIAKAVQS